jgi:hypothetical protein
MRRYTDEQLADAVEGAHSWRGVLRLLGLAATSAGAMRSVRAHADRLGLDYDHFTGQRRWTDAQLAAAIASSRTWVEVCDGLGLAGGSSTTTVRGHAVRLGLDTSHFVSGAGSTPAAPARDLGPEVVHLRRAGPLLAASWFELSGLQVSWPLEPCRYDLVVWRPTGATRVQVKTGAFRTRSSWMVRLSSSRGETRTYDPDEIDEIFVIDGDFRFYLIPVAAVGGLTAIHVSAYRCFQLRTEPWIRHGTSPD